MQTDMSLLNHYQGEVRDKNSCSFKHLGSKGSKIEKNSIPCIILAQFLILARAFLVVQLVQNLPPMRETQVRFPGWEDPLEKGQSTHSSILGLPLWFSWYRICLQCKRPGFDSWVGKICWRRDRLLTPVFWSGEFHGLYSPWSRKESDMIERLLLSLSFQKYADQTKHLYWLNTNFQFLIDKKKA